MINISSIVFRRGWLLWLALSWGCLAGWPLAHAQDHIVERSWLEDPSGQLSWPAVQQKATQPYQDTLNRGYGTGVLWLRLRIDPGVNVAVPPDLLRASERLVLRMRPAYVDQVTVFDPLVPDGLLGVVGDRQHPRQDVLPGTDFLLPIARGEVPRDIWLRLESTSTRQVHVQALTPYELHRLTLQQNLIASLYLGAVAALMVWALVNRFIQHEGVMGAFVLMQLTAVLYGLSSSGILRVFWPAAWPATTLDTLGSVFSVVVVGAGLWFHLRFLREFRPARWAMGLLVGLLAQAGVNLGLLALGQIRLALEINMLSILVAPPVCLACAVSGKAWSEGRGEPQPALSRRVLVSFYLAFVAIFILASTTGLGWFPAKEWTLYISQLHTLVSSLLLMLMLQYRASVAAKQRQQEQLALQRSTLQVAHERQLREEQEKLLAMLAHEVKTPLAIMHLRLDNQTKSGQAIRQAMRDMNGVIDRCLQTLQLGDGKMRARIQPVDLVVIARDAASACAQPDRVRVTFPPSVPLETDPQILSIVLINLLENACKYSAPETPIELGVSIVQEGGAEWAKVELTNWPGSAGWPDAAHIWDKYYRSPKAKRLSGTGLGLFVVKNLTQTLGGRIVYAPNEQLIRFVLTLPIGPRISG